MFWLFGNFSRPGSRIRIRTTYVQIVHCTTNADPCHWPKLTPLEYRVDLCTSKDLLRDKKFHPTCSPTRIPAAVAAGLRSSARRCTPPPRPIQYNNVNPLVTNHFFFFDESLYRVAMWSLNWTSKISGKYLHSLPRYRNLKKIFLTVHWYFRSNCF